MQEQRSNLAFVFPGQGSQAVGMLAEIADSHPEVQQTFAQASEILGRDLWQMTVEGPAEILGQTQNTQPLVLTAGYAMWRVWCKTSDIRPALMAGHSLGEYTALTCAGALAFEDAVAIVEKRALYMQEAVPAGEGAMAAILGLDGEQLNTICADAAQQEVVSPVNYNAPGQIVIAGNASAVGRAIEAAKAAGAKRAMPLPVSVPSHCALMLPASERLAESLANVSLQAPAIPVIQNVDVTSHSQVDDIKARLVEQLHQPVRWIETVEKLHASGVENVVECGPGKVLCGLNKRIVKALQCSPLNDPASLSKLQETLS
ncbi:MAG TPA: ACP S-malonyltransferase [Xanthomonadales bacterium]|nr:ACP S-malonyltransferase [Xanthomonadales bacterium]